MTKKIPCRVISSVPIGVTGTRLQPERDIKEHLCEFYNSPAVNIKFVYPSQTANIDMGIFNTFPTGQFLDCLA